MVWLPRRSTYKRRSKKMSNYSQGLPEDANNQQVNGHGHNTQQGHFTHYHDGNFNVDMYQLGANLSGPQWHNGFSSATTPMTHESMEPYEESPWYTNHNAIASSSGMNISPPINIQHPHPLSLPSPPPHPHPQPQPTLQVSIQIILEQLRDYLLQASWVRHNEKEPPMPDNDPLFQLGLVQPGTDQSRFNAFLFWDGEKDHCRFPGCQGPRHRTQHYTTERRPRALSHVYGHFAYKPIACGGECGRVDCDMRFPDRSSRTEHARSYNTPRVTCTICNSVVAKKNYKRHARDTHRLSEEQFTKLTKGYDEAGTSYEA